MDHFRRAVIACLAVLILSAFSVTQPLSAATRVAVIDLQAKFGVEAAMASLLTDSLRAEIYKSKAFTLMNREDMTSILKEVKFQQSGGCADTSCIVAMGNALGIEKMVAGSVGRFGKRYSITVKLVNIAQASNEILLTEYYEGKEERLPEFIQKLAKKISEKEMEIAKQDRRSAGVEATGSKEEKRSAEKEAEARKKAEREAEKKKAAEEKKREEAEAKKKKESEPKVHSPVKAAMLGLLPGVGQLYNGQRKKAYIFAGLGALSVGGMVMFYSSTESARDAYLAAVEGDDFAGLHDDFKSKRSINQFFVYSTIGIAVASATEAYLCGRKIKVVSVSLQHGNIEVSYGIHF